MIHLWINGHSMGIVLASIVVGAGMMILVGLPGIIREVIQRLGTRDR